MYYWILLVRFSMSCQLGFCCSLSRGGEGGREQGELEWVLKGCCGKHQVVSKHLRVVI